MKTHVRTFALVLLVLSLIVPAALAQQGAAEFPAIQPEAQDAAWTQAWWMKRHEEKKEEAKKAERIDLLMVGDSITHGWETGGKAVFDEYYGKRHALNLGFSGDRTEHVLWRLDNGAVDGLSPKLAVVMIGTNNTGHRKDPPEQTAAGIEKIIEELRTRMPAMKILLLAIFPREPMPDGELRKINDGINEIIKGYADGEHVSYLDINHVFLEEKNTASCPRALCLMRSIPMRKATSDGPRPSSPRSRSSWERSSPSRERCQSRQILKKGCSPGITAGSSKDGAKKGLSSRVREQGLSLFLRRLRKAMPFVQHPQNRDRPVSLGDSLACVSPGFAWPPRRALRLNGRQYQNCTP